MSRTVTPTGWRGRPVGVYEGESFRSGRRRNWLVSIPVPLKPTLPGTGGRELLLQTAKGVAEFASSLIAFPGLFGKRFREDSGYPDK